MNVDHLKQANLLVKQRDESKWALSVLNSPALGDGRFDISYANTVRIHLTQDQERELALILRAWMHKQIMAAEDELVKLGIEL